jgi:tRNA(Ile)-lysidine synthase
MKHKKKNIQAYSLQFINYINHFIKQTGFVFPAQVCVAVSGGKDSMALLTILAQLRDRGEFNELHVFHVNHGTRKENDKEEHLVKSTCKKLDSIFHLKKLYLSFSSNFEMQARDLRREFFKNKMNELNKDAILCTGHHLDDSFEWTLMQQMKTSGIKSSLGIPLKQGFYLRPLLCVSKSQIERYIKYNNIEYIDDPSNENEHFERNFIRKNIIPKLKYKYPKMLKHYAYRQNKLALNLGVSLLGKSLSSNIDIIKLAGATILYNKNGIGDFTGLDELIEKEAQLLSSKDRGRLSKEVSKLISASKAGKEGPFNLSGGVKVYYFQGSLILLNNKGEDYFKALDSKLLLQSAQIPDVLHKWPLLAFGPKSLKKRYASLKKVHPLFPFLTQSLLDKGCWFQHYGRLVVLENKEPSCFKYVKVYNLKDVKHLDSL